MKNRLDAFFDRRLYDLAQKIGIPRTRILLRSVLVILTCLIPAIMGWAWITSGPMSALVGVTVGLALNLAEPMLRNRINKSLAASSSSSQQDTGVAPSTAKFLLYLFLPKKIGEPLLGDLEEEYRELQQKFGTGPAQIWFYKQVLAACWPTLQIAGRTLARWGLIGWLEEVIRRIAH